MAAVSVVVAPPAAAAPANDDFANATVLSGSSISQGPDSNAGATKEVGEPDHAGDPGGASVWYKWIAPDHGTVIITTAGSGFDTLLAVYTGHPVSALTRVTANNDDPSVGCCTSRVRFTAISGTTYRIAVDGFEADTGTIMLGLTLTSPPGNDNFANATVLSGASVSEGPDSNVGATKEPGEPKHAGVTGGASVWYAWTAPAGGAVTITTTGSDFDTLLGVYAGSGVSTLTEIAGNDDNQTIGCCTSRVRFTAVSGTTFRIAVDGYAASAGDVMLGITLAASFPNDFFIDATPLGGVSVSQGPDVNVGYTKENGEPNHAGDAGGASAWYSWTAPGNGTVVVSTAGSDFDTLLGVYTGSTVSSLTPVAANNDGSAVFTSRVEFFVTSGTTFRIAVDGYAGATGNISLALTFTAPPANDDLANSTALSGASVTRGPDTNAGATAEASEPIHAGSGGGRSIWYSWTSPGSGGVVATTSGSDFDTVLGVYTGSGVSTLTEVASNDEDPVLGGPTSRVEFVSSSGTTYRIAVDGYSGAFGNATLHIDLAAAPETRIDSGPSGTATSSFATFTFSATDAGGSGIAFYECRLDSDGWSTCTSPAEYKGLADGSHTFEVRATDGAGNTDPSPASRTWTVQTGAVTYRPDALIKVSADAAFKGDGIYNTTGEGQTRRIKASRGESVDFMIEVQNDSVATDSFVLTGPKGSAGFRVTYMLGSTKINSQVTGAGFPIPTVPPGNARDIVVKVKVGRTAEGAKAVPLTFVSQGDPSVQDVVVAKAKTPTQRVVSP